MLYSPRLRDDQIRALYQLKLRTKCPMTRLLQEAADAYLHRYQATLAAPLEAVGQCPCSVDDSGHICSAHEE